MISSYSKVSLITALLVSNSILQLTECGPRPLKKLDHKVLTQDEIIETENYLINQKSACLGKDTLIVVKSKPENYVERNVIRSTWGRDAQKIKKASVVFFLGQSQSLNVLLNDAISVEDTLHGDIVQGSFLDTQFNSTLKGIFVYRWLKFYCEEIELVVVCNDDALINLRRLNKFILDHQYVKDEKTLYCSVLRDQKPIRTPEIYRYVSKEIYSDDKYPDYCSESAYLMTGDSIFPLYDAMVSAFVKPKFWLDDIFITGLAANQASIIRMHSDDIAVDHGCTDAELTGAIALSNCELPGIETIKLYKATMALIDYRLVTAAAGALPPDQRQQIDSSISPESTIASPVAADTVKSVEYQGLLDGQKISNIDDLLEVIGDDLKELLAIEKTITGEFSTFLVRVKNDFKDAETGHQKSAHNFFAISWETAPYWLLLIVFFSILILFRNNLRKRKY